MEWQRSVDGFPAILIRTSENMWLAYGGQLDSQIVDEMPAGYRQHSGFVIVPLEFDPSKVPLMKRFDDAVTKWNSRDEEILMQRRSQ